MGINYNTSVVRDGLVLHLDAANVKSYPGTGTTWNDLSGRGNNGTLTNGPSFDANNKGGIVFDGITDVVVSTPIFDDYTVEAFFKPISLTPKEGYGNTIVASSPTASSYYPIWILVYNNQIKVYANSNAANAYLTLTNFSNITTNQWFYVSVSSKVNGVCNIYVNGNFDKSFSAGPQPSNNYLTLGDVRPGRAISYNGDIGSVKLYNRILSEAEIQQNFNAMRDRYGI